MLFDVRMSSKSILDKVEWAYNPVFDLGGDAEVWADARLSLKAKGVYGVMNDGGGSGWSAERVCMVCKDGRDAVLKAMKELEECGYLSRVRLKTGKMEYKIADKRGVGVDAKVRKIGEVGDSFTNICMERLKEAFPDMPNMEVEYGLRYTAKEAFLLVREAGGSEEDYNELLEVAWSKDGTLPRLVVDFWCSHIKNKV